MSISTDEFRERINRATRRLYESGCDALLACGSKLQSGTVRYLTGYAPWLTPGERAFLIVRPSCQPELSLLSNSSWDFWNGVGEKFSWIGDIEIGSRWVDSIERRLSTDIRRVGIADWHGFPASVYEELKLRVSRIRFVDITAEMRALRTIKSPSEVETLSRVGRIADAAGNTLMENLKTGISEQELALRIDQAMIRLGARDFGYPTILGSGSRTEACCFRPTSRVPRNGDLIQLDCSPVLEGYQADFSRVTIMGKGSKRLIRLVDTVVQMYEYCYRELRAGVPCSQIARAGILAAQSRGYSSDHFFSSANYRDTAMGHGIGLENPDPPGMVTPSNQTTLQENMVINLEPLLIEPGLGSARIEGAFLITSSGAECLSTSPLRLW